jgi:hypothetical protein
MPDDDNSNGGYEMSEPTDRRRGLLGLWMEAGEDRDRYRELLIEHGVLIPKDCGHGERCGCQDLPCGWGPGDA